MFQNIAHLLRPKNQYDHLWKGHMRLRVFTRKYPNEHFMTIHLMIKCNFIGKAIRNYSAYKAKISYYLVGVYFYQEIYSSPFLKYIFDMC